MGVEKFTDLLVWREAHQLVLWVYALTKNFPADEKFGLVSQMRRAAISIPANIAEGFKRRGLQDKIHFYNISEGSLEELKYFFIVSKDLGYTLHGHKLRFFLGRNAQFVTAGIIYAIECGRDGSRGKRWQAALWSHRKH